MPAFPSFGILLLWAKNGWVFENQCRRNVIGSARERFDAEDAPTERTKVSLRNFSWCFRWHRRDKKEANRFSRTIFLESRDHLVSAKGVSFRVPKTESYSMYRIQF